MTVSAETEPVGPGYHRFVGRLLERMATDLSITWDVAAPKRDGRTRRPARRSPTARPPNARISAGSGGRSSAPGRCGRPAARGSRSGSRQTCGTASMARSRRSSARATTRGSSRRSPTRASRPTSRPGGPTRPTGSTCSTARCALMWLEVRWRPPAMKRGTRPARRDPSDADQGIPDRTDVSPIRGVPGPSSSSCAASTSDGAPGDRRGRARAGDAATDRLPTRPRHHQPRGLGARDPGFVRRTPDGRGMVGRRRGSEHHPRRGPDRDATAAR